jgi:hypothetical protein
MRTASRLGCPCARQRSLDALAVGLQRQRRRNLELQIRVLAQPPQRSAARLRQLEQLARLLVQREARGLDARDLQHLFQERVQPLCLALQDLHVLRIARLTFLQPARERIGEALDAGERRLQLVSGEREEAILARLALGGGQHGARAGQERLQRAQVSRRAVELERERAHHLLAHPQRHRGGSGAPFDEAALQRAYRQGF